MALDHYVSQVHLRKFYSPVLGDLMYATRKSDLKFFRCDLKSVCRIEENSTNAYLINDRAIENFLLSVEPRYNAAVDGIRDGEIDRKCITAISGFVAFVTCCAPAAMRIHVAPLQNLVASEVAILDRQGLLPRAPPSLGKKTATELLTDGTACVNIDPKFPQAVGISTILNWLAFYGNSRWEVLQKQ